MNPRHFLEMPQKMVGRLIKKTGLSDRNTIGTTKKIFKNYSVVKGRLFGHGVHYRGPPIFVNKKIPLFEKEGSSIVNGLIYWPDWADGAAGATFVDGAPVVPPEPFCIMGIARP